MMHRHLLFQNLNDIRLPQRILCTEGVIYSSISILLITDPAEPCYVGPFHHGVARR
jgi:hypothetical protein